MPYRRNLAAASGIVSTNKWSCLVMKKIALVLCLVGLPVVAHAQGPVGGSESPGVEFYSTTTGVDDGRNEAVLRSPKSRDAPIIDRDTSSSQALKEEPLKQRRLIAIPAAIEN
jgi:hypothetical protein